MTVLAVFLSVEALYTDNIWLVPAVFYFFTKIKTYSTLTLFTLFNFPIPYILWHTFNFISEKIVYIYSSTCCLYTYVNHRVVSPECVIFCRTH